MLHTGLDIVVARRTAGLTQTELARLAGMNRSRLSQIEWSARRLKPQTAEQLERALKSVGTGADRPNEAA